ncbi:MULTISPECIES: SCO family protein [Shewanella]|uniref:SCO family protein n=1 Tax=Shewanella TaxID=22 RepID=UPI00048EADA2|nr:MULTISPECIES: SCO family protein [Shewanella]QLE87403.1 SCO family protein [Shewanella sp. Scap07]
MPKLLWIVVAVVIMTAGSLTAVRLSEPKALQLQTSFVLPQARPVAPFKMQDQYGNAFTEHQLLGKWSLVFIGYTSCPDVCPTTMGKLSAVYPKLKQQMDIQVIFLSADPERDTQARLLDYMNFFNPEFIAITGEHKQLHPLSRDLGFVYAMVGDGEDYQVDHSASMTLISPQGLKVATIKPKSLKLGQIPQIANAALVSDVVAIVDNQRG